MTNTTKYVLIGGAALLGAVLIARKMTAQAAAASKPSGIAGAVAGIQQTYESVKGLNLFSKPATTLQEPSIGLAGGGKFYGPGAVDGTASGPDAMGLRALRPQITKDQQYYDPRFAGVA